MVQRKLAQREVTGVALQKDSTAEILRTGAKTAGGLQDILVDFQEKQDLAKMNDFMADANVEMIEATSTFRLENEANPNDPKALSSLDKKYRDIFGKFNNNISVLGRGKWSQASNKMINQYKADNAKWGIKQNIVNSENSINRSITKNLNLAAGLGKEGNLSGAFEIFQTSKEGLEAFGKGTLGEAKTNELITDYESDYMKMFISGMAEVNPDGALTMLDDKRISESITNPEDKIKLREMVKGKITQKDAVEKKQSQLDGSLLQNDLTMKALTNELSFVELQESAGRVGADGKPLLTGATIRKLNGLITSNKKVTAVNDPETYSSLSSEFSLLGIDKKDSVSDAPFGQIAKFRDGVITAMSEGKLKDTQARGWLDMIQNSYKTRGQRLKLEGYTAYNAVSRFFRNRAGAMLNEEQRTNAFMEMDQKLMEALEPGKNYSNEQINTMAQDIWKNYVQTQFPETLGLPEIPNAVLGEEVNLDVTSTEPTDIKKADFIYNPKTNKFEKVNNA